VFGGDEGVDVGYVLCLYLCNENFVVFCRWLRWLIGCFWFFGSRGGDGWLFSGFCWLCAWEGAISLLER